ncbi:MAG: endo alpha-1,4 polygalactosaminidase [Anaerovoracaceae bacterium]|nr:endo alpha-1,4 polygalactosaminidase [Anaerovoracaceae bacterium]
MIKTARGRVTALIIILAVICAVITAVVASSGTDGAREQKPYGVFLGINRDQISELDEYKTVVIEPEEFTKADVAKLRDSGKVVYAYLNIGAVENYRDYYDEYKSYTLGVYEDWPDERWVDVSKPEWRDFIAGTLAKKYAGYGYDGFFLDNADVYYHYKTDAIYEGLCDILEKLSGYDVDLVINGGDAFVTRAMKDGKAEGLIDAVNQETVFTSIDFENKTYGRQDPDETEYFESYLENVRSHDIDVYLLEYGADRKLAKKIGRYCDRHDYKWYNAKSLDLK